MTDPRIKELRTALLGTKREGIENLVADLEGYGFYKAPCSGGHHLAREEGLLDHSLNVFHIAQKIGAAVYGTRELTPEIKNSITICSLLHDIGKVGQFGKPNYVPNILKGGNQSTAKPYTTNNDLLYVDHEIRSIVIIGLYIDLTEDEQFAILYHNGMYGNLKYGFANNETPLSLIIHWADMWASRVMESKPENNKEDM